MMDDVFGNGFESKPVVVRVRLVMATVGGSDLRCDCCLTVESKGV